MQYLFLVVLGGRINKANVELHDVRWVVGSKIEDTYDVLRRDWFGSLKGLHIDSYKKIEYINGYKIGLKNLGKNKTKNVRLVNKLNSPPNCGLLILEAMNQVLCKKSMNLD